MSSFSTKAISPASAQAAVGSCAFWGVDAVEATITMTASKPAIRGGHNPEQDH